MLVQWEWKITIRQATKILENGGKVAMPKYALPGMAWQGYFIDTEGNIFGHSSTR